MYGGMGIDTSYPLHPYFVAARGPSSHSAATAQLRRLGDVLAGEAPAQ